MLLNLGFGWLGPPRSQQSQDFSLILSLVLQVLHSPQAGTQSLSVGAVSRQVRSKVRGLSYFVSEA